MSRAGCFYSGNAPGNDDYKKIGSIEEWDFYATKLESEWIKLKVVSKTPREYKANYWLSYNFVLGRFANGKCSKALDEKTPELKDLFTKFINKYIRDTILSKGN